MFLVKLMFLLHIMQVFFPMLSRLLGEIVSDEKVSLEETRVRASNLLCKVGTESISTGVHSLYQLFVYYHTVGVPAAPSLSVHSTVFLRALDNCP